MIRARTKVLRAAAWAALVFLLLAAEARQARAEGEAGVSAYAETWGGWWGQPSGATSLSELAAAHAIAAHSLSVRVSLVRTSLRSDLIRGHGGGRRPISLALPPAAFVTPETWTALVPPAGDLAEVLLATHGKEWGGVLSRGLGDLWWGKGELQLCAMRPELEFTAAWEAGSRMREPPRMGGEHLAATVGASTLVAVGSSPVRLVPQPASAYTGGWAMLPFSWSPEELLFGQHLGGLEPPSGREIQQRLFRDATDGALVHLIDSRQGSEVILSAFRYLPDRGYINNSQLTWLARLSADGRISGIGFWMVVHRWDFVTVACEEGTRSLPSRVLLAVGSPDRGGAAPPLPLDGLTPNLADLSFLAEWELAYDGDVSDFEARLELAVEEHLKKQWEALEAAYASEEYRRLSSDPMPESVEHRQKFPQLITDRRFFLEGVATNVHYRWSRPLPSDAVIQQAAHTPGQSYLDPADRPPLPPGAPGGAAAGSASPTLTRYARWKWWSWSVAGGALLLLAVLRLARGRRPRRAA